jgi:hypothetical protein
MSKAEKFIQDYTRGCSNELEGGVYHEWLTPEQARAAVEIEREELIEKAVEWLYNNYSLGSEGMKNFRKAMNYDIERIG